MQEAFSSFECAIKVSISKFLLIVDFHYFISLYYQDQDTYSYPLYISIFVIYIQHTHHNEETQCIHQIQLLVKCYTLSYIIL